MLPKRKIHPLKSVPKRKKNSCEYYNPPENSTLANYCLDSSLHGLQYICQKNRHCFERIFWLIAFLISVVCAGGLIFKLWETYMEFPIVTVFNPVETPLGDISFPSVTICNVNKLKLSKATENFQKLMNLRNMSTLDETPYLKSLAVMEVTKKICNAKTFVNKLVANASKTWTSDFDIINEELENRKQDYEKFINPTKLLADTAQACSEMLVFCMWQDEIRNCSELFRPIVTDYGYCCTFNMIPTTLLMKNFNDSDDDPGKVKDWEESEATSDNLIKPSLLNQGKFPYRQNYPSKSSGLSVMLEPNLTEYACTSMDSEGFVAWFMVGTQVGLSLPLDFPRMKDGGILVQSATETFIKIHPQITVSDATIKRFPLDKRSCYIDGEGEHKLPHYTKYTADNCLSECISKETLRVCKCVLYYMPRNPDIPLCKDDKYNCATEVEKTATDGVGVCSFCLRTCTDIRYHAQVTALRFRQFHMGKVFDVFSDRKKTEDLAIVHFYFGQETYQTRLRREMYTVIDLISSAGGLLGLCMGFSMLSVLEIVYYCTIRIFFNYQRKYIEKASANKLDLSKTSYYEEMEHNPLSKKWSRPSTTIKENKDQCTS